MFKEIELTKIFAEKFKLTFFLLIGCLFGGLGFIAAVYPRNRRQKYQGIIMLAALTFGYAAYLRFQPVAMTTTQSPQEYWAGTLEQHISLLILIGSAFGYAAGAILRRAWHWQGIYTTGVILTFTGTLMLAISSGFTRQIAVDLTHDSDIKAATANGMLFMSNLISKGQTEPAPQPGIGRTIPIDELIKKQFQPNLRFTK